MYIIPAKDYKELSEISANIIAEQVKAKPNSVLGLATGGTPVGIYKELIKKYNDNEVSFKNISTANLDEYVGLSPENDQSYAYFMRTNLFDHIDIDSKNLNIPNGQNPDALNECKKYEETIKNLGGVDLQLLGLGHNGHIGFNEPADVFSQVTNCVKLTDETIKSNSRFFEDISEVPTTAYTMGIGTIMQADKILLVVSGADKADILYRTVKNMVDPKIPSTILQFHKNVVIVADKPALAKLNSEF